MGICVAELRFVLFSVSQLTVFLAKARIHGGRVVDQRAAIDANLRWQFGNIADGPTDFEDRSFKSSCPNSPAFGVLYSHYGCEDEKREAL